MYVSGLARAHVNLPCIMYTLLFSTTALTLMLTYFCQTMHVDTGSILRLAVIRGDGLDMLNEKMIMTGSNVV